MILVSVMASKGQVFNTGQTLKPKIFSVGLEPAVIMNGGNDFILFVHGGYGLKKGIDFGLTLGTLHSSTYLGANVEFTVARMVSLAVGAHNFGSFGLDGTLNLTFPIAKGVKIFSGLDTDINFPKNGDTQFLLWIPVGVDIPIKNKMTFIFEAEIGLTSPAYNLLGGGVLFYF